MDYEFGEVTEGKTSPSFSFPTATVSLSFFLVAERKRKVDRVTANHYLSLTASQETSNIPFP